MKGIKLTEMMGENVIPSFKYCGKGVKIYPLTKINRAENVEIDDFSRILDYVYIDAGKSLKIGKYSIITWQCLIEGGASTIIGDRVFIGPGTKLLTSTYAFNGYYTNEFLPEGTNRIDYGDIVLEDDSYIGANSVVMPGVKVGEGALVGSNAFVNKDLDPWGIYVGSPAKKIGERQRPTSERQAIIDMMDWTKHF